ncbi:MAG: glycosyltransferase family protein [Thermoanaerobaculia bacterium]
MPRVAFYAHDTYGLGHLSRCLKLAFAGELPEVQGVILSGSPWHGLFTPPPGFRVVPLPPVIKRGRGVYAPREGSLSLRRVLAARARRIRSTLERFRPDLLVVDNVPCGLHREVLPALRQLKQRPGARAVLALRDVLDRPSVVAGEWARAGALEPLTELYDEVWVFGDAFDACDLARSGPLAAAAGKVRACGHLGRRRAGLRPASGGQPQEPRRRPLVLVTGGGGGDAPPLVRSYLEALRRFRPRLNSRLVLGPDYPVADLRAVPATTAVRAFEPRLADWLATSDVVVSMAGYNTVCEILESGRRAVLVPRVWPRQEQWLRALRWQREGRVRVIHPGRLSAGALWREIERVLAEPAPVPLGLGGGVVAAGRAARLLKSGGAS